MITPIIMNRGAAEMVLRLGLDLVWIEEKLVVSPSNFLQMRVYNRAV